MSEMTTEIINEHFKLNDYELHVTGTWNDVEVWLNTPVAGFDGLCIGGGPSKRLALAEAEKMPEQALKVLRGGGMRQPFDIELTEAQYEHDRNYWQTLAEQRATAVKQLVVIVVEGSVRYRAWPPRDSIFKGYGDEQ